MQHQLGTDALQHGAQRIGIGQRLAPADRTPRHRVMQHDDAHPPGFAFGHEHAFEAIELLRAEPATRQQRRRRQRRIEADQRQVVQAVHERPAILEPRPGVPQPEAFGRRHAHQRIVVAWNQADALGRAERREPAGRLPELARQREIGDVTGDDDVIDRVGAKVPGQRAEDVAALHGAPAPPRPDAELPFRQVLAQR